MGDVLTHTQTHTLTAVHAGSSDLIFDCAPQMGFDGPLSAQEQMYILYEIKMQCYQNLSNTEPGTTGTEILYAILHIKHIINNVIAKVSLCL